MRTKSLKIYLKPPGEMEMWINLPVTTSGWAVVMRGHPKPPLHKEHNKGTICIVSVIMLY